VLVPASFLLLLVAQPARAVVPPAGGGPLPGEVVRAIAEGLAHPAARPVKSTGSVLEAGASTTGRWNVPVLLVAFPDRPPTYPAANFTPLLFDTVGAFSTGSMAAYYDEVSGGLLKVRGKVFGWKTLPDTMNFYANDSYGLARLAFRRTTPGFSTRRSRHSTPTSTSRSTTGTATASSTACCWCTATWAPKARRATGGVSGRSPARCRTRGARRRRTSPPTRGPAIPGSS
jgi:hypothetical protein